ncbi:MAG: hypothetical protein GC162_19590 [Planctomycetes bacterium]|nr:hypothetical protein [Planctomycetota bacterium]
MAWTPLAQIEPQPWHSRKTRAEVDAVNTAIDSIITCRQTIDEDRARLERLAVDGIDEHDIASADTIRANRLLALREEVAVRHRINALYQSFAEDATKAHAKAIEHVDAMRADLLSKLHGLGFGGDGVTWRNDIAGCVYPGTLNGHAAVREAREHVESLANSSARQEWIRLNRERLESVTRELRRIRDDAVART